VRLTSVINFDCAESAKKVWALGRLDISYLTGHCIEEQQQKLKLPDNLEAAMRPETVHADADRKVAQHGYKSDCVETKSEKSINFVWH